MGRAALRLGVRELAQLADVSPTTITKVESDVPVNRHSIRAVLTALENAGVDFIPDNGSGPGVRLRKRV